MDIVLEMQATRRLLLIVNRMPAGGAETQLLHLSRGLARLGNKVTLCCIDSSTLPPETLQRSGVSVVELGVRTRYRRMAAIPRLVRMARNADVVHCTLWDTSLWGRIAAILARRPVIVADHATDRSTQVAANGAPRDRWIALHNRLLDRFTFATVACAGSQRPVLLSEGVAEEKIVQIPNGIPVAEEIEAATTGPTRADLGLPDDEPLLMQVGRFSIEKNQLAALEAVRRVRSSVPGVRLAFVGDGPMRTEVEHRAAEVADGWVHFLGFRSDAPAVMSLADMMLLPSIADAMPMVVLESMALGVPVVATDVGDVCWTLDGAGHCVEPGDIEALSRECIELLDDPAELDRMREAGRRRATEFDASLMVRRYEALFDAAFNGSSPVEAVIGIDS